MDTNDEVIIKKCKFCKTEFEFSRKHRVYCSSKCSKAFFAEVNKKRKDDKKARKYPKPLFQDGNKVSRIVKTKPCEECKYEALCYDLVAEYLPAYCLPVSELDIAYAQADNLLAYFIEKRPQIKELLKETYYNDQNTNS